MCALAALAHESNLDYGRVHWRRWRRTRPFLNQACIRRCDLKSKSAATGVPDHGRQHCRRPFGPRLIVHYANSNGVFRDSLVRGGINHLAPPRARDHCGTNPQMQGRHHCTVDGRRRIHSARSVPQRDPHAVCISWNVAFVGRRSLSNNVRS